jgi:hypothetical protein
MKCDSRAFAHRFIVNPFRDCPIWVIICQVRVSRGLIWSVFVQKLVLSMILELFMGFCIVGAWDVLVSVH